MSLQSPVQITFHQTDRSDVVEADIRDKVAQLEQYYENLISCRVVVEHEHFHHHERGPVTVRFELVLPGGKTIVGGGSGTANAGQVDAATAVKAAFEAVKRQLHDYVEKRRRHTKVHEVPPHGVVLSLDPDGGFGFLQTSDGLDVYFHRNAVVETEFEQLRVGDAVRFILHAEEGVDGPQAASVQPLGKHQLPNVEAVRS